MIERVSNSDKSIHTSVLQLQSFSRINQYTNWIFIYLLILCVELKHTDFVYWKGRSVPQMERSEVRVCSENTWLRSPVALSPGSLLPSAPPPSGTAIHVQFIPTSHFTLSPTPSLIGCSQSPILIFQKLSHTCDLSTWTPPAGSRCTPPPPANHATSHLFTYSSSVKLCLSCPRWIIQE